MRSSVLVTLALAACSARPFPGTDGTALDSQLAAELADAGVNCLPGQPPPFAACAGLDAGVTCSVGDEDHARAGVCHATGNGRLVCADRDDDNHIVPLDVATAACEGLDGGAACRLPIPERETMTVGDERGDRDAGPDDDDFLNGTCRLLPADGGDVLACVPGPGMPEDKHGTEHGAPIEAALGACLGDAAGAVCSFTWKEHGVNGVCTALASGALACAPTCRQ
jgi:hypothetical protein